jgi:cell division protein FtsL
MNKGSKANILYTLFLFIVFTLLGLGYVSIKLKCEQLTKDKVFAEEKLNAVKNTRLSLVATEQNLSSEERIVKIAKSELGMVKKNEPYMQVKVSKEKIDEINKALQKKYE